MQAAAGALKEKLASALFQRLSLAGEAKEVDPRRKRAEEDPILAQRQPEDPFRHLARMAKADTSGQRYQSPVELRKAAEKKKILEQKREEWQSAMSEQRQADYFNREVFSVMSGKSTEL